MHHRFLDKGVAVSKGAVYNVFEERIERAQ
jgi:hypothetical protein